MRAYRGLLRGVGLAAAILALTGCGREPEAVAPALSPAAVVKTNADLAYAVYSDSLATAEQLQAALTTLVQSPSEANLAAARQAWLAAREPYGQSEIYRFRAGPIDALREDGSMGEDGDGPEGRINAWPQGEGLIDYVAAGNADGDAGPEVPGSVGQFAGSSIIASEIPITKDWLAGHNEMGEDERNVVTGYHAIEFLLWGQDLNAGQSEWNSPRDASAGQRPWTDYARGEACTSGPVSAPARVCERRGQYLLAVGELLVDDLGRVAAAWDPRPGDNHYAAFVAGGEQSLARILESMGRLGFGELAGERINIALLTNSQEDEHSCFSDNTHRDIYLNAQGIENSYLGRYTRVDGSVVQGTGVYDLLKTRDAELAETLRGALAATMAKAAVIDAKAKQGMPFDQQVQLGIDEPHIHALIDALVAQTAGIESAIKVLGLSAGDLRQDTEQQL